MHRKAIGNFFVTTYPDSEAVDIEYRYNDSASAHVTLRSTDDVVDLGYLVECIRREQSRRAAQRRGNAQ